MSPEERKEYHKQYLQILTSDENARKSNRYEVI